MNDTKLIGQGRLINVTISTIALVLCFAVAASDANARSTKRELCNAGSYAVEQFVMRYIAQIGRQAYSMPSDIRSCLAPHFDSRIGTGTVRYVVAPGMYDTLQQTFFYGSEGAVTLGDFIVFSSQSAVNDRKLWAHELHHVQQYRSWGRREFLAKYCKDQNEVERDAREVANAIERHHDCVSR